MNQSRNLNLLIAILIVVALGLGAVIASKYLPTNFLSPNNTSTNSSSVVDNKSVLKFPGPNSSADEIRTHSELVQKEAKATGNLDISSGCAVDPLVLQLKVSQNFTINNKDGQAHTLNVGDLKLTVPANSNKQFIADFGKGAGNYGYSCDSSAEIAGIFQVVPNQ